MVTAARPTTRPAVIDCDIHNTITGPEASAPTPFTGAPLGRSVEKS